MESLSPEKLSAKAWTSPEDEGRESVEQFHLFLESVEDYAIFIMDPAGNVVSWNGGARRLLGWSADEALGQSLAQFFTAEDRAVGLPEKELGAAAAAGRASAERWHVRKDGSRLWCSSVTTALRDDAGRLRGFAKVIHDLTERKRHEDDRRASEQCYWLLFERNPLPAWVFDRETLAFLAVNDAAVRQFGYTRQEFLAMTIKDIRPAEAVAATLDFWSKAAPEGTDPRTWRCRKKDGTLSDVELSWQTIDFAGRTARLVLVQDVTARRRALDTLKWSEMRFRHMVENNIVGIVIANFDGRITDANDSFLRMVGYDRAALKAGRLDWRTMTPPEYADRDSQAIDEIRQSGECTPFEKEYIRKDGSRVPILLGASLYYGGPENWVCFVLDLSKRKRAEETLRASEKRFRSLIEHSWDAVALGDRMGVIQYVSPASTRILGYAPEELIGRNGFELVHPDDLPLLNERMVRLLEVPGRTVGAAYRYQHKNGSWLWIEATATNLLDDPSVAAIVLNFHDVTARRHAEASLKRSEMRFRHMVQNNVIGIILATFDGKITDANESFLRMVGYDRADLLAGKLDWRALTPPEYLERDRQAIEEIRREGACAPIEKEYIRKDGSRVPILVGASLYYGGPEDCVCFVLDRSERQRAEESLRASEKRFRSLIEHSSDAVSLIDRSGIVRYVSPAVRGMLGLEPEELVGRHAFDFLHPADLPMIRERFAELALLPGMTHTALYRYRHKDGSWRWIEGTGTNLLDDPSIGAIVGNYRDVTERRQLIEALELRAEELTEANRRKDEFLAMLAHELRNPLAPILNGLHILRQDRTESPILQQARLIIERQVQNMVRLVDDLLDVSRITRGKIQLRKERVELRLVLDRAIESAKTIIEARRHKLTVSVPSEPISLESDPTRLEQVFTNLLTNAAKYTDPGGQIWLAAERQGGDVVVQVCDNGMGIAPKMLAHVFDLFTQANRALDRSQGGLGIGLTVVKRLVEMHGGSVSAASAGPGKGSTFTVRLPALAPVVAAQPHDSTPAGPRAHPLHVLVVEDNVDAAESVAMLLRLYGHEVQVVHTGPAGLEAAHAFRPNVVLLDIGLPGMDGYEVAKRIRQDPELREIPLIAMTGYSREEDRSRSREAGIDQHLVKPVEPEKLQELLTRIERPGGPQH